MLLNEIPYNYDSLLGLKDRLIHGVTNSDFTIANFSEPKGAWNAEDLAEIMKGKISTSIIHDFTILFVYSLKSHV